MGAINCFFTRLNGYLWGPPLLILLFGTHLFMTVRTGVIQRKIGLGIRLSVYRDKDGSGDISQFGALTTSLAATLGTGNIVGVGTEHQEDQIAPVVDDGILELQQICRTDCQKYQSTSDGTMLAVLCVHSND